MQFGVSKSMHVTYRCKYSLKHVRRNKHSYALTRNILKFSIERRIIFTPRLNIPLDSANLLNLSIRTVSSARLAATLPVKNVNWLPESYGKAIRIC